MLSIHLTNVYILIRVPFLISTSLKNPGASDSDIETMPTFHYVIPPRTEQIIEVLVEIPPSNEKEAILPVLKISILQIPSALNSIGKNNVAIVTPITDWYSDITLNNNISLLSNCFSGTNFKSLNGTSHYPMYRQSRSFLNVVSSLFTALRSYGNV